MSTFLIVVGVAYVFALIVQMKLAATNHKWSQINNSAGLTGAQTAYVTAGAPAAAKPAQTQRDLSINKEANHDCRDCRY